MTDIRDKGWHLHMKISGVAEPVTHSGSIMELTAQALTHIRSARVPTNRDGVKEITIHLATKPVTQEMLDEFEREQHADSMLDASLATEEQAVEGETYDQCFDRLTTEGYDRASALMIAADLFGLPTDRIDRADELWLADSRAVRFRQIHASQQSYDSADPHEAAMLKSYCEANWPDKLANMRLRD